MALNTSAILVRMTISVWHPVCRPALTRWADTPRPKQPVYSRPKQPVHAVRAPARTPGTNAPAGTWTKHFRPTSGIGIPSWVSCRPERERSSRGCRPHTWPQPRYPLPSLTLEHRPWPKQPRIAPDLGPFRVTTTGSEGAVHPPLSASSQTARVCTETAAASNWGQVLRGEWPEQPLSDTHLDLAVAVAAVSGADPGPHLDPRTSPAREHATPLSCPLPLDQNVCPGS